MTLPASRRLLTFGFALGGFAFAAWLALFFHDAHRPVSPQERADRLAATNYLAAELSAPVPPSPAHWAQRLVWQNPESGVRHPIAREDAALVLAASGANPRVAGVIACGLATAAVGWLALGFASLPVIGAVLLTGATILGFTHALAWQMTDPAPFLLLASASLALGAWFRHRQTPTLRTGWLLGLGLGGMLLGELAPTLVMAAAIGVDLLLRRRDGQPPSGGEDLSGLGRGALLVLGVVALLGVRNLQTTGSVFLSPAQAYAKEATTAPDWFWQTARSPQEQLDPILERYDELVALPKARRETPVYRDWMDRILAGANRAGGLVLAFFALTSALVLPSRETRPAWLVATGSCVLALLRHQVPPTWWAMLAPSLVALIAIGAARLASAPAIVRRIAATGAVLHCALLGSAPQDHASDAEYVFDKRMNDVIKKLKEQPEKHLVFVGLDNACDGILEPANLPRDWRAETILFARDLGEKKNAELVAAMPAYKPSEIKVLPAGIGLKPWKPAAPAEKPAEKK